jgi:hypothetical protein
MMIDWLSEVSIIENSGVEREEAERIVADAVQLARDLAAFNARNRETTHEEMENLCLIEWRKIKGVNNIGRLAATYAYGAIGTMPEPPEGVE